MLQFSVSILGELPPGARRWCPTSGAPRAPSAMVLNPVGQYKRLGGNIKCIRAPLDRLERRCDILGSPYFDRGDLKAERSGRCLNLAALQRRGGTADVGHDRQASEKAGLLSYGASLAYA